VLGRILAHPEREHQGFDGKGDNQHHHEAREEAPHPRGRAHLRLAVDLLLKDRLAELERGDRHRKDGDALEHRVQPLANRRRLEELDPLPELRAREHHEGQPRQ
jgi:hypothetical protein